MKSHTKGDDFLSKGNEAADIIAKWACRNTTLIPYEPPDEESFILKINGVEEDGDGLKALKRRCRDLTLDTWKKLPTQGRLLTLWNS